jgi:hypothetical protein
MKLTELNPRWVIAAEGRHGMGLSLLCPLCQSERLVVWFKNPLDGGPPIQGKDYLWDREGETFETVLRNLPVLHSVRFALPPGWFRG